MKKIILFSVLLALLAGCSEKEIVDTLPPDPFLKVTVSDSTNLQLQEANAKPYNLLGHGYDATGFFFNALSGRAKVLDIERMIELHPGRFGYGYMSTHDSQTVIGYSAEDLVKRLSNMTESYFHPNTDSSKWNMFCGQLSTMLDPTTRASESTYGLYQEFILLQSYTYFDILDSLKCHLTEGFHSDLQHETPEFMLKKYGTHVLTNVQLGGKIQVMYKTSIPEGDVSWKTQVGLSRSVLYLFGHSLSISDTSEPFENREQEAYAIFSGGMRMEPLKGVISTDTITRGLVNITPWLESIRANPSLINVDEDHFTPIYELVDDPAKREALKSAYNTYFLKSKASLLK